MSKDAASQSARKLSAVSSSAVCWANALASKTCGDFDAMESSCSDSLVPDSCKKWLTIVLKVLP